MTIKIGVQAFFDSQGVTNEINKLGKTIAQANKAKFDPVPVGAIKNMDEIEKRFQKLLQLNREMARRVKVSGQSGTNFVDLDWGKLYDNDKTKSAKMAQAFQFVTGTNFSGQKNASSDSGLGNAAKNAAARAAQAGLGAANGATGGVGNVASGAIGKGMSAGFGAGLMGLVGGVMALGVSKIVSSVTEKMGEAEANSIANDRLKRVIGDVSVSFEALESSVRSAADQNHVLYSEGAKLTSEFSKLANIKADEYKTVAGEAGVGIGLSRSLGIDSSNGVNALGVMRGVGITKNDQDTRRMALLIGETIGKSDAFSKSAEVMDAISGYAAIQTKLSLSAANVGGYAGLLSGMISSGTAGLDPSNSANILSKIVSTLQQGGGAGEASQFFSSIVSERNGLNPIAGSVWRESPLSSSKEAFGGDTAVGKYLSKRGVKLPGAEGGSFYGQTLDLLKQQYKDPWMLLEASSRHLGISKGQAAAMIDIEPKKMGELEGRLGKDFDLSQLKGESIATMGRIITGDKNTFNSVAGDLRSRTGSEGLSTAERQKLDDTMANGSDDEIKDLLLSFTATRGQEQTQGKDIHDSKVALDNVKTLMASQLIPLTQDMRAGILYLAGKDDGLSGVEVLNKIAEAESKSRVSRIERTAEQEKANAKTDYQKQMDEMALDPNNKKIGSKDWFIDYQEKVKKGTATEEDKRNYLDKFESRRWSGGPQAVYEDHGVKANELKKELESKRRQIEENAKALIEKEGLRLGVEKISIDKAESVRLQQQQVPEKKTNDTQSLNSSSRNPPESIAKPFGGASDPELMKMVHEAEKEIGAPKGFLWAQMGVESDYRLDAKSGAGAQGLAQVMPSTLSNLNERTGKNLDPYDKNDAVFIQKELMKENFNKFKNWDDAARAYNGGWSPDKWANKETREYVPKIKERMREGTPIEASPAERQSNDPQRFVIDASPIEIIHRNERGQQVMPSQSLTTTIRPAAPFGTARA
jgi:hypothetical protein